MLAFERVSGIHLLLVGFVVLFCNGQLLLGTFHCSRRRSAQAIRFDGIRRHLVNLLPGQIISAARVQPGLDIVALLSGFMRRTLRIPISHRYLELRTCV